MTTDPKLKELSIYLAADSTAFISGFIELFMFQYEVYIETSTFPPEQSITTVLDLTALISEELHGACAEVMDSVQHVPGMFIWGFIKA